ncbi:baseplate wedge subunit [Sinorhizobium phage phiM7]|uniref:Baseplate wedge subunit n=3 Tax=Emdodecavirus TaxID=1980937 RepID=S5MCY8_9CAUD|nr:baseplate wedge subunit [Sinorhizobium phage phiM12]YP_009212354.1 baseplate wedge subunit [Sinorhizobium phage phiN3]YP_009601225.1 baseplate wedge subunit [Sinorhizobium phage phiM7]AKF13007.1 baseplate wedge subunit [Sinorhizobium phage phiM19]AGR47784.1 baseplate wedge subunit [Sinorhizobium phage phiM12]AKF12647.1 baseplate wedge subunit [Sinorhizobium phage phiM7]AKF13379.1 baseplate wedge subunit [Sinorhizobium phage phiN3]
MSSYFSNFPKIKYNDQVVRNIMLRVKILDKVKHDPYAYLPYTVKEGERAEDIAFYYYGSTEYIWLVFLSNKIIDPYFEWPLSENELFLSLAKKYRARAMADMNQTFMTDFEVFNWTMNEARTANIEYYQNGNLKMTPDTYSLSNIALEGWQPIRIFDVENERNENMRNIQLLNNSYAKLADDNIRNLLND